MPSKTLACDICFNVKERCVFAVQGPCQRCEKLGRRCVTTRKRGIAGRPRKPDRTSRLPVPGSQFVWNVTTVSDDHVGEGTQHNGRTSSGHAGDSGRRDNSLVAVSLTAIRPSHPILSLLKPRQTILLRIILDKRTFANHFVLSARFAEAILTQMIAGLWSAGQGRSKQERAIAGIQLACAGKIATRLALRADNFTADDYHETEGYKDGATAVQALRDASVNFPSTESDLIATVVLAVGIATFDLMDTARSSWSICRFTISLAETSTHRTSGGALDRSLVPLVYLDTCNCIVRGQVPATRLALGELDSIDRYVGLCVSLFPILYDICLLGCDISVSAMAADKMTNIQTLEGRLCSWATTLPEEYAAQYTPAERDIIETQAELHRLAARLILRHIHTSPRGPEGDDRAHKLSSQILSSIFRLCLPRSNATPLEDKALPPGMAGCFDYRLNFPFLVAAVESTTVEDRTAALHMLPHVVSRALYPSAVDSLEDFLLFVWASRDEGYDGSWFDLATSPGAPSFILF